MSWPEAVVSIVSAICIAFAVVHVFGEGIVITIRHEREDD